MATASGQTSWQPGFQATPHFGHMAEQLRRCIQECLSCFSVCEQTLAHCLRKGGKHAAAEHVKLLVDCAECCRAGASMMSRESAFHARMCALCADVCKACEESCEEFRDDQQMTACADACRSCHDACRAMGARA
ncbi:four-helix bundle copper-binding protein [Anaeromyxobacter diazotrophicus]|uniref:Ferredoxin n=1 Tax=Anaeromyxobacter diazotrophicus TaxID=2590199 RepID=A0A7I9VG92_9BACT|nr:four-helix bundle copper-binding protein [Anaeromyxobacter diazotrophicus]GEJ55411.1 ferredoxin [Anaeromyxobacter diazotrophicus]